MDNKGESSIHPMEHSPHRENDDALEFPASHTHVIIDPNQMSETERTGTSTRVYKSECGINSATEGQSCLEENEQENKCNLNANLKMTVETGECLEGNETEHDDIVHSVSDDVCKDVVGEDEVRSTQEETIRGTDNAEETDGNKRLQNDNGTNLVKGDKEATTSVARLEGLYDVLPKHELHDAHFDVDEDDGLTKFFSRVCGVSKKMLLDEDSEPYSKSDNPNRKHDVREDGESALPNLIQRSIRSDSDQHTVKTHSSARSHSEQVTAAPVSMQRTATAVPVSMHGTTTTTPLSEQRTAATIPVIRQKISGVKKATMEDVYDFTHNKRGYMLLIVNDRFDRQSPRQGAHWDLIKMKEIATKFGFRSLNYNSETNLTKSETLNFLKKASETDHSDCDCFLFMISTHGLEQKNAAKGGQVDHALVCSDEQMIFTSTILDMFSDDNCPKLRGKPKLFYIQACRGDNLDEGGEVKVEMPRTVDTADIRVDTGHGRKPETIDTSDTRHDDDSWMNLLHSQTHHTGATGNQPEYTHNQVSQQPRSRYQGTATAYYPSTTGQSAFNIPHGHPANRFHTPTPYAIVEAPSLKCHNDMMVMFAIPPGMFAWRNTTEGSWMIDYLHKVLMQYDMRRPKSFLSLMTKVTSLMSHRITNTPSNPSMHEKTAVSVIEHKLTKDIMLEQKVPLSDWIKKASS